MTFLFASGIENSYPTIRSGVRIDQMEKCGHYGWWEEDLALASELRLDALRYGPPYYRTHLAPDHFDWSFCDEPMLRLKALGLEVIADLCHFGTPSWLGGFQDEAFPMVFAEYARAFARRYPWVRYFTPVNEIFIGATFSALHGWWNECQTSDVAFVRALRNLCMAHELAVDAILRERQDAVIIQAEAVEHFHAKRHDADEQAAHWNMLKCLALDLTLGHELSPSASRYLKAHGMTLADLAFFGGRRAIGQRWLGVDYYKTSEHTVDDSGMHSERRQGLGLRALATWYHRRYGVPLFHCETNRPCANAVGWMQQQWREVLALRASGIPVFGFTWYSVTDQIDWQHALRVEHNDLYPVGLFDLDRVVRPVGRAYGDLIWQHHGVHVGRGAATLSAA